MATIKRILGSAALVFASLGYQALANNVHNEELNRDYTTINGALADPDIAAGQTLRVDPGTYNESVDIIIDITLKSTYETDPPARDVTLIIGGGGAPAVDMTTGTLQGLTITGSRTGVYAGGDATVIDNIIRDNISATFASGGVYAYDSAQILFNEIRHNAPCGIFGSAEGGGVFAGDDALIMGNLIEDNFGNCESPIDGGDEDPNAASRGGGVLSGGGLYMSGNSRAISNMIRNNSASYGGGVSTCCGTQVLINNTITGNTGLIFGGAIITWGVPAGSIANNIIAFHAGKAIEDFGAPPPLVNNLFFANFGGDGPTGTAPVFADPLLDADGIHLLSGSPAINAGDASFILSGELDIDETARVQDTAVDIGADEAVLIAHNLTAGESYLTIQSSIDGASDGDEIEVDPGIHLENIDFLEKAIIVRSLDPLDDVIVADTIIDGGGLDCVVQLSAGLLSGFTIRNGSAIGTLAGGVEADGTAVVSHNVVTGNLAEQRGGGVSATDNALVHNNRIIGNTAGNRAGGVSARDDAIVVNNIISNNHATIGGGGLRAQENVLVRNNTMLFNSSEETGSGVSGGGGILAEDSAVLLNNIVALSVDGVGIHVAEGDTVVADYNCLFANADGDYGGDAGAGMHDLNADPLLESDGEHLSAESPCVDAGDPATVLLLAESDIDNEVRIQNSLIDIGADETTPPSCAGDANGDGLVDPLDAGFVQARFGCLYPDDGEDCLDSDVNGDDLVDPLDLGFVIARFGDCPQSR